jgi:hypothetical protein
MAAQPVDRFLRTQENTTQKETDRIRTYDIIARKQTCVGITHLNATVASKHISLNFIY